LPGKGCLGDAEVDKLRQLNFRFDKIRIPFETRLNQLIQWKAARGHTRVPMMVNGEKQELGLWVSNIRRLYHLKRVKAERVEALNKIQFDWTLNPRGFNGRDSSRRANEEDGPLSDED
jgi:Helicase associated domain